MNPRLRATLRKVPGAAAALAAVRRLVAVPAQPAPEAGTLNEQLLVNHGVGTKAAPFTVTSGADREQLEAESADLKWFHTFEFSNGFVGQGVDPSPDKVRFMGYPDSFEGLTVLDIGAFDGYFSFEAARRGAADVLATDEFVWNWPGVTAYKNFQFVRQHTGLPVRDQVISVENLTPEAVGGEFDVVLFLGVLYHAPDPLGYLQAVRSVTRKYAIIETVVDMLHVDRPALGYYPGSYLNRDASNFFGPNLLALEGLLIDAGFREVENLGLWRSHELELVRGAALPDTPPVSGRAVVRAWV